MLRQLFGLFALCLCLSFVKADYGVSVTSADFVVDASIVLGKPQWSFHQKDNASFVYSVSLMGMWEIENGTNYDLVENSYVEYVNGWSIAMGAIANNSQGVSIMTQEGLNANFDSMALKTHVPMWAVNGSDYPAGKFDVDITNYKWVSMSSSAQLVLSFGLEYQVDMKTPMMSNLSTHGSRTVDFSGAYFSINSTAMGGIKTNTSISVTVKLAGDVNASHVPAGTFLSHNVYVIYDHFETSLHHDPEFGFGEGPGNSYIWIIIIVVVVIAIIVIILIAVIGFILVRRRRRSYDAF